MTGIKKILRLAEWLKSMNTKTYNKFTFKKYKKKKVYERTKR